MTWALPPSVPAVPGLPLRDDLEPIAYPECAICRDTTETRTQTHEAESYSTPPNPSNPPPSNR